MSPTNLGPAMRFTPCQSFFFFALLSFVAVSAVLMVPPATAQSGSFGAAVHVDNDILFAGEPNTYFREGSVYVYASQGGDWVQTDRITSPDPERADGFGTAIARTGNTLFIGQKAGPLHIFEQSQGTWRHAGRLTGPGTSGIDPGCNSYGYCETTFGITLAADGDWLFVGATGEQPPAGRGQEAPAEEPGAVHVYHRGADGTWTAHSRVQATGAAPGDHFGARIHMARGRALISAPRWGDTAAGVDETGRVVEFALRSGKWEEVGSLPIPAHPAAHSGSALAVDGNEVYVGAPGWEESRGAVLRFRRPGVDGAWTAAGRISLGSGETGDRFGSGVAVSNGVLWVGAPTERANEIGSVYVYGREADGSLSYSPERIQLEETVERDNFGAHIVAAGASVVVDVPGMHHRAGAVMVYIGGADGGADASPGTGGRMLVSPPDALGAMLGERRECDDGKIGPFDCSEVELLSFIPNSILRDGDWARGVRTNDNWGWTDPETGREYALVGRNDGTSFIDITDPVNPVLIGDLPKPWGTPPTQLWRDIKTYKDHAFIVADGAGDHGMQVFDLRRLRDVANPPEVFEPDLHYTDIASSHNVIINEETGYAYTVDRQTCGGGLYMMNIEEPLNPVFEGCVTGETGTHDAQCVMYQGPDTRYTGHEICLNSNGRTFDIADVTDKDNPVTLATASSPNAAYIHQGWLTDDHRYFYQDDESDVVRGNVETTRTLIWDLTNLEDPVLTNEFMGSMPASAHNLYLKDGFAYQANYRYGMHVLDIADPENPVEVGYFDTSPYQEGPGFSGAWSTFPFYKSGTVLVTSLQEGLFVLKKKDVEF